MSGARHDRDLLRSRRFLPLYALIQDRSAASERSRMIGANNIANAGVIVAGAVVTGLLTHQGVSAPRIILIAAGVYLAVVIWMFRVWRAR